MIKAKSRPLLPEIRVFAQQVTLAALWRNVLLTVSCGGGHCKECLWSLSPTIVTLQDQTNPPMPQMAESPHISSLSQPSTPKWNQTWNTFASVGEVYAQVCHLARLPHAWHRPVPLLP